MERRAHTVGARLRRASAKVKRPAAGLIEELLRTYSQSIRWFQIKLQPGTRPGLVIPDLHLLKFPLAVHLFEGLGVKLLKQFAVRVIRLGLDYAECFIIDPRDHARITVWRRTGILAFQYFAGTAAPHFVLQDFLLRPMKEFQAQIAYGKIRPCKRCL